MCGRFTFTTETVTFMVGKTKVTFRFPPRFNLAPTQAAPIIVPDDDAYAMRAAKFGLIPFWSDEPKVSYSTTNAKSEELTAKPTWRPLLKKQRCLVAADGYYEWTGPKNARLPWRFTRKDGKPFCFAGLWSTWQKGEHPPVDSFTIITTAADKLAATIHHRMPVILAEDKYEGWLTAADWEHAKEFLVPEDASQMQVGRVNPIVNNARNETPHCIDPA